MSSLPRTLRRRHLRAAGAAALAGASLVALSGSAGAAPGDSVTGVSSSQTPYLTPVAPGVKVTSIVTSGDKVNKPGDAPGVPATYEYEGTPDGIGAYSNGDGTYTIFTNHEFTPAVGVPRAHGSAGAFVTKLVVNQDTTASKVQTGDDLIKTVVLTGSGSTAFNRFCSADLPAPSAFFNSGSGKGSSERIFMNGEESGAEGRAFGHVATGPSAGTSYELPSLGKFSWENSTANPATGDKTVVAGTDDSTPGQVYVYIGDKATTGTEVAKAGLVGGGLYGIRVQGLTTEDRTAASATPKPFTLATLGDVSGMTGAALQTASTTAGVTEFLRPEDSSWDPSNPNVLYFATTDRYDQAKDNLGTQTATSRLWRATFTDINSPIAGGTIEAVLDGTETGGGNMFDNITVNKKGDVILVEDVGGQAHNGRVIQYTPSTDTFRTVAKHDVARNGEVTGNPGVVTPATAPFNNDEEFSGIVDASDILGANWYLVDDQQHYTVAGGQVEGGQLMALFIPDQPVVSPIVPEVPKALLLPAGAMTAFAAAYVLRRRRAAKA